MGVADIVLFATGDFSHLASIFILLHKIVQLKVSRELDPTWIRCATSN